MQVAVVLEDFVQQLLILEVVVLLKVNYQLVQDHITVVVGSGGDGPDSSSSRGSNGSPSTFGSIVSQGGGGGGSDASDPVRPGSPGGSGGGGASKNASPYTWRRDANKEVIHKQAAPTQGYAGGTGYNSGYESNRGGGGGGAGAAGSDGGPSSGAGTKGDGGAGLQVLIAGPGPDRQSGIGAQKSRTRTVAGWFGGGGAGGTQGPTHSDGGVGGGANGGDSGQHLLVKIILSKVLQTLVVVEVVVVHLVDLDQKSSSGIVIVRYPIGSVKILQKQPVVLLVLETIKQFMFSRYFWRIY